MMAIPRRLTRSQVAGIVENYATAFPEWEVLGSDRLIRTHGPIMQQIGFEALRSGGYRPAAGIRAVPLSTVRMLHQFLDVKHREISLREHPVKWNRIVTAMEEQFQPAIRKTLDFQEIRKLCEKEARESTNDLCMLAILYAYLGEKEQALSCCERMQHVGPPTLAPRQDWEDQHREFGNQLRNAIEVGNEHAFLDAETERELKQMKSA